MFYTTTKMLETCQNFENKILLNFGEKKDQLFEGKKQMICCCCFFQQRQHINKSVFLRCPFFGRLGVNACRDGLGKLVKVIFSPEGKKNLPGQQQNIATGLVLGYITQKQKIPFFHLRMICGKKSVVVSSRKFWQIAVFCICIDQRDLTSMIIYFEVQLKM